MRKLVIAAGLVCALTAVPLTAAGAATTAKFKGKGTGTLTLAGSNFTIDGTVHVANVGAVSFHSSGATTSPNHAADTTTFTAPNGDTITTSSTGTARNTRLGRIFVTNDTVTGGTGRFADAAGRGKTAAKAKLSAPNASTGTVKFVLAGTINF
jgi:hypothetical protein